jgi:5'-3' exonuclease
MVKNYLESLLFTLRYYTEGCPSWSWHYRYRVAPIPSDVFTVLDKRMVEVNTLSLEKGTPYTPFQQLMMILPPKSMTMLPPSIAALASHKKWKPLYPDEFEVDALAGMKYIYSEALLPEHDEEETFLEAIRTVEKTLLPEWVERNRISDKVKKFVKKN